MTLYADMLFLVNFIMNGFVLWVLAKVMRAGVKARWLLAGSGVMALLYSLLLFVEALRFVNVIVSSVVILCVGVGVAFRPRSVRNFAKFLAVAYIISFTVGGLGMALFFLTTDWDGFMQTVSWQLVLVGVILSYIAIKFGLKMAERLTLKRQMLCSVCITIDGNDCNFNALVDTGHSLKEPLSKSPVIIAEFEYVKHILPDSLKVLFYEKQENDLTVLLAMRDSDFHSRIRMIPFSSLGRSNGMLIGFRPDSVKLEGAGKENPMPDVIIGIYNNKLCTDGKYSGLMSPELVA